MANLATFTTSDPQNRWPNGGPSWVDGFDPYSMMQNKSLALKPRRPDAVVNELAEYTFAATDISAYGPVTSDGFLTDPAKRPLAAGNPDFPLNVLYSQSDLHVQEKNRVRYLVELTAYYSACAIIWTLQRCGLLDEQGMPKDTITPGLSVIKYQDDYASVPHFVPAAYKDFLSLQKDKEYRTKQQMQQMQLMLVMGALAPILALAIIPTTIYYAIKTENDVIEVQKLRG